MAPPETLALLLRKFEFLMTVEEVNSLGIWIFKAPPF